MTERTLASIVLPWPSVQLGQNGRASWRRRWTLQKAQKKATAEAAMERGLHMSRGRIPEGARIALHWRFEPSPRAAPHYDDDNFEGCMKSARDQIAVTLGVDDNRFDATKERGPVHRPGGRVVATVSVVMPGEGT